MSLLCIPKKNFVDKTFLFFYDLVHQNTWFEIYIVNGVQLMSDIKNISTESTGLGDKLIGNNENYITVIEDDKTWLGDTSPKTHVGFGDTPGEAENDAMRNRSNYYND